MSWSTGSSLMADVIAELEETDLRYDQKIEIYKILIDQFENYDCDTLYECVDDSAAFKEAFAEMNPDFDPDFLDEDE